MWSTGDKAWIVLGAAVVAYEILSPDGELLSEAFDRYVERFPIMSRVLPMLLTLHVTNSIHRRADVVHMLAAALVKVKVKF